MIYNNFYKPKNIAIINKPNASQKFISLVLKIIGMILLNKYLTQSARRNKIGNATTAPISCSVKPIASSGFEKFSNHVGAILSSNITIAQIIML